MSIAGKTTSENVTEIDTPKCVCIKCVYNAGESRVCENNMCNMKIHGAGRCLDGENIDTPDYVCNVKCGKVQEMARFEGERSKNS